MSAASAENSQSNFRQLVSLTLPIMLSLCVINLVGFSDRTFLARFSLEALEGYVSGFVLAVLFQIPLMRVTTLGQSFVSFYNNDDKRHQVGQSVWQMIWFSLFSMCITLPVSYGVVPIVFGGTAVQDVATSYFTTLMWGNFLFPLQAALSSFFIGQNRAKVVFITVFGAQCIHVILDYLLIFGVDGYIPALGAQGAAIALVINQLLVCGILFLLFLGKKQRSLYGTDRYQFNWAVFFAQIRAGIPLSVAPFIGMSCWVAINRLMAVKGGDYLVVFSLGSSLTVCFAFMNDALFQAVLTSVSGLLGRKSFAAIKRTVGQAFFLLGIMMGLLAIPFLIYPEVLLSFLFPSLPTGASLDLLLSTCYSSWLFICCEGVLFIGMGLLAATRQTLFFIFTGISLWFIGYLPIAFTMDLWQWQAETFWPIIATAISIVGGSYFLKAKQLISFYKRHALGVING